MQVTPLVDLIAYKEAVPAAIDGYKIVTHYSRSPRADELISVSTDTIRFYEITGEPYPYSLKPIGYHPESQFLTICSRSDSGSFWRTVAVTKYKILMAQNWLWRQLLRHLYLSGMLAYPAGEEITWRHLRLDWLLICGEGASYGIALCGSRWLTQSCFTFSVLCFATALFGWVGTGRRKTYLIGKRDRELREISLRSFFRLHDIVPDPIDFEACAQEQMEASQIVAVYRAMQGMKKGKSSHPCIYHHDSHILTCAVHPSHKEQGLCNEQCPSFATRCS